MIDEGYIKYRQRWTKTAALSLEELDELCRWRTKLRDVGLIGEYPDSGIGFGNLSARIGDSPRFLISGTQTGHFPSSGAEQFSLVTRVDIPGNEVECEGPLRASSEAMTHAAIYAADAAIRAVAHVHDSRLWDHALEKLPTTGREIPYGTPAMAKAFAELVAKPAFRARGIAAMAGHDEGLVSVGRNIAQAAQRMLEFRSEVYGAAAM